MRRLAAILSLGFLALACGSPAPSAPVSGTPAPPTPSAAPSPAPPGAVPSPSPTFSVPATGFAFDAESVVNYYRTRGYSCAEPKPSTNASGYLVQSCQLVDPDGRTRVIGVVTDPAGELADGFASVRAREGEAFLQPTDALEPLAGFLGAMLGEERGAALLPWLAAHLGDEYAETMAADLHVATYLAKPGDRRTLVVEIANDGYLESPGPSPS